MRRKEAPAKKAESSEESKERPSLVNKVTFGVLEEGKLRTTVRKLNGLRMIQGCCTSCTCCTQIM